MAKFGINPTIGHRDNMVKMNHNRKPLGFQRAKGEVKNFGHWSITIIYYPPQAHTDTDTLIPPDSKSTLLDTTDIMMTCEAIAESVVPDHSDANFRLKVPAGRGLFQVRWFASMNVDKGFQGGMVFSINLTKSSTFAGPRKTIVFRLGVIVSEIITKIA